MKTQFKKIAKERIRILLGKADETKVMSLSKRYVTLARKIAMKHRVRIPSELQKKFCKHCYTYLRPGVNCRVRTQPGHVVYTCFECKKMMRFPFVKEKKAKINPSAKA